MADALPQPQDLDAEQYVLGAALLNQAVLDRVRQRLRPDHFYLQGHQRIYQACLELHDQEKPVDPLSVAAHLLETGHLTEAGGKAKLNELANLVPSAQNAPHYAEIVVDRARGRDLIRLMHPVLGGLYEGTAHVPDVLELVQRIVDRCEDAHDEQAVALNAAAFLEREFSTAEPLLVAGTEKILVRGGFHILVGPPSVGKTTLALDLIVSLCTGQEWLGWEIPEPVSVLFVENEGPESEFQTKLKARLSVRDGFPYERVHVWQWKWGNVDLTDRQQAGMMHRYCRQNQVQVVFADPLATLGVGGVGSPDDTIEFVQALRANAGLGVDVAFVMLHHFRKEGADTDLDKMQGSWGQHADTVLTLKPGRKDEEVHLQAVKVRHGRRAKLPQMILGKLEQQASYELIATVGSSEDTVQKLVEALAESAWSTAAELSKTLGIRRQTLTKTMSDNEHLFVSEAGQLHGRRDARSVVYNLKSQPGESESGGEVLFGTWNDTDGMEWR